MAVKELKRKIFIINDHRDEKAVELLTKELEGRGHKLIGLNPGDLWPSDIPRKLADADIVLALFTKNSVDNPFVIAMAGMALGFSIRLNERPTIYIPVALEEEIEVPRVVAVNHFINVERFYANLNKKKSEKDEIDRLSWVANEVDRTAMAPQWGKKIFVSHAHSQPMIAEHLVHLLNAAFNLNDGEDIRCTSHPDFRYRIPITESVSDMLLNDLRTVEIVLGVLTPNMKLTDWVFFELGASWITKKPLIILLAKGAKVEDIPRPLRDRPSLNLSHESDCKQLIEELTRTISASRREEESHREKEAIARIVDSAKPGGTEV